MMTADSIKVIDDDYVKRIHSRQPSGHIHKGHGIVAANASIPTKFQTIVTDNSDKRGFLRKTKRFQYDADVTDNPGPGKYLNHVRVDNNSTSFSKRGTGGFASKTKRNLKYEFSSAPGPGIYSLPGHLQSKVDFNKSGTSRLFHTPIAVNVIKKEGVPAPGSYEVLKHRLGPANNVTANAAFRSQTQRTALFNVKKLASMPGPGHYEVKDELLHDSGFAPTHMFQSRSKRKMADDPPKVPGPGAYKPHEPVEQPKKFIFPRKHYLCISAPAMPLPSTPPPPGPGSYEVVDYEGPPKHYMSGSAFVSTTSRWTGDVTDEELPGPAHYRPLQGGKQSFIYNAAGRWI